MWLRCELIWGNGNFLFLFFVVFKECGSEEKLKEKIIDKEGGYIKRNIKKDLDIDKFEFRISREIKDLSIIFVLFICFVLRWI